MPVLYLLCRKNSGISPETQEKIILFIKEIFSLNKTNYEIDKNYKTEHTCMNY